MFCYVDIFGSSVSCMRILYYVDIIGGNIFSISCIRTLCYVDIVEKGEARKAEQYYKRAGILWDNTSGSSETRVSGIIRNILYY